jgi:aminotransferase in exopolysaccharide biosynthesis
MSSFSHSINFIKNKFENREVIPLHEPKFNGNEKEYILDCIDSTYVSSVGAYVDRFELMMALKSQTSKAIAVVNGTAGIQVALKLCGVSKGDEVITQALTFIATANAISYLGASPIFLDVDLDTMGLSPIAVSEFLENHGELRNGVCFNKKTNNKIAACLPMHTFGFPVHIEKLIEICDRWNIPIVEDAAESLGSEYNGKSTGSFGKFGVFSFNGNKIVTCGGGGAIVTNDRKLGINAKHITTTAKVSHPFEYIHDDIGYNFRMPNLNAALACAQLEQLDSFLDNKRMLALEYKSFFDSMGIYFRTELPNTKANYWLMCLELENRRDRDSFLKETNDNKVMTRPIWQLLFKLPMYEGCQRDSQRNANYLEDRIVNIPSSVRR